jgi:hypothetical protein
MTREALKKGTGDEYVIVTDFMGRGLATLVVMVLGEGGATVNGDRLGLPKLWIFGVF